MKNSKIDDMNFQFYDAVRFARRIVLLILGCGLAGCSAPSATDQHDAPSPSPKSEIQNLKSERGVFITRAGEAAAEVETAPVPLFEVAENFLRGRYKITFINRTLRQIEAETKTRLLTVKTTALTTGGTGLCVAVINREDRRPESEVARRVANEILAAFEAVAKK